MPLRRNLATLEVGIDAGTPETYTAYKGRDAFDRVVKKLMAYRDCGAIQLKYIAGLTNVTNADVDGFVELARRVQPKSIVITAEMKAAFLKTYDDDAIKQVARLIEAARSLGIPVSPASEVEGILRFPNVWPMIAAKTGSNSDRELTDLTRKDRTTEAPRGSASIGFCKRSASSGVISCRLIGVVGRDSLPPLAGGR